MKKTVKLYGSDGKFVKELTLPPEFRNPPSVIFYGTRAFSSLLIARGEYSECSCWRAPEPEVIEVSEGSEKVS